MRLYLINPFNSLAGMTKLKENYWNRYRVWKPLGLLVVAGLTPPEWHITVIDENLGAPDYDKMPRPDLVGITAFTAQAVRAYEIAAEFREQGVPVVLGGIHATMRSEEALHQVDAVVTGEAENVWPQVLEDVRQHSLRRIYEGTLGGMEKVPLARHDLLPNKYRFGSIQTTRGCPLSCSFCSVTAFNGKRYRHRPIKDVIEELKLIREKYVLMVDDNIIGTRQDHIRRTKDLFQAIIKADICKKWIGQATVNMADDEELLDLAAKSGCFGVFIGFESPNPAGLAEVHKQFNVQRNRDLRASVKRIQRHGLLVLGSFIIGLDVDKEGIGLEIADAARDYGLDAINVLCLTPLPGTELWDKMETEGRIVANTFPADWKYYTFGFPVAKYRNLSSIETIEEMEACRASFYSYPRILGRVFSNLRSRRKPVISLVTNLSQGRNSSQADREAYLEMKLARNHDQTGFEPASECKV